MSARGREQSTSKSATCIKTDFHKENSSGSKKRSGEHSCRCRVPGRSGLSPPARFLKHLRDKVAAAALRLVSQTRRRKRSSPGPTTVSSAGKSNPSIAPVDSHRAESIKDCIDFINSSSSLKRSNSLCTSSQS